MPVIDRADLILTSDGSWCLILSFNGGKWCQVVPLDEPDTRRYLG